MSSANAWIVGTCIVVVPLRVPIVSGPRVAELIKVGLGAWLLVSPVALGVAGSGAAWNAWIVGALIHPGDRRHKRVEPDRDRLQGSAGCL